MSYKTRKERKKETLNLDSFDLSVLMDLIDLTGLNSVDNFLLDEVDLNYLLSLKAEDFHY